MRRLLSVFILVALVAVLSSPLGAQTTTGALQGTVADQSGAVLPGVTVELTGERQIGGAQVAVTDQSGQFRFPTLAPGLYVLRASLAGFKTVIREGVQVQVGRTFNVDFSLELGSLEESITVTGESPIVDVAATAVTTNYSQEMVKNLPVTRFSVFDLFQMVPGVSSTQVQDSTRSSALGSSTDENQYRLDGTDLTSPTSGGMHPYPNTDIVEELEFIGVGAPAEYGNLQGAVFNVVTKSGSNDVHALGNWFSQYDPLTGNNTPGEAFPYHRDEFNDATIQIGGPFARDTLWWFASYQYRRDLFSEPGTDPRFPTRDMQDRVFGKLTWQISPTQRFMFAYHDDIWRLPSTITSSRPPEASSMGRGLNPTPTATWHSLLNNSTSLELRYGGFYNWSSTQGLRRDLTTPGVEDISTGQRSVNVLSSSWSRFSPWQTGASAKLSRFIQLGRQDHDLRFGAQFMDGKSQSESVWPGGRNIYLDNGQPAYIEVRDPSVSGGRRRTLGFYVDDGWAVTPRVKLNLGVRFDIARGWIQDMPKLDVNRNEVGTVEGIDDLIDWKSVSPRVGVNIQLRRTGGSVLRASYGRYYQGLTTNNFSGLSPAQAITYRYGWNAATGQYDVLQRITDPRSQFHGADPNLKQPFTDQYTIGADHELAANLAIGVSYVHKRSDDFLGRVDVGSTYAPRAFTDPQTGNVLTVFNRVTAPDAVRIVLTNPEPATCSYCTEEFRTRYDGVLLTLTKRMSQRWQAIASLTLGKMEGLHAGSGASTGGSQNSAAGTFGDDPNEWINVYGLMPQDRNAMGKLQASYILPYDVVVSTNWQWIAGRPYTRKLNVSGLRQGRVTVFAQPRDGSLRLPAQNFVDMRFEKRVEMGGRQRLTLMADVLNLLNIDTPLELITEIATSSNFGKGETVANPRRAMMGLRFEF